MTQMTPKKMFTAVGAFVLALVLIFSATSMFETVEKGTYQIKQAAITGTMSAKMTPGLWGQWWGDIDSWNKAETYFFTADKDAEGDTAMDNSIEVRFNDGSVCHVEGTARIAMPTNEQDAIELVTQKGFKTYPAVEDKLIRPHLRNVLRTTANLMSAKESYDEKRADFVTYARDQIQNGLYQTEDEIREVKDLVSGEMVEKAFKVIKLGQDGLPRYQDNPLDGTGITVHNFEIKRFRYATKVNEQIATQQEALMAVATAKAKAEEAEQDRLTIEAQGKAKVAQAQYEKEQDKIRAIVEAEQKRDVAALEKQAAEYTKQKEILLGQGEAERKKLVLNADGALAQKLQTYEAVMSRWADAYENRKVPANYLIMGGGGNGSGGYSNVVSPDYATQDFTQAMQLLVAGQLGLDLTVPQGAKVTK